MIMDGDWKESRLEHGDALRDKKTAVLDQQVGS